MINAKRVLVRLQQLRINCDAKIKQQTECGMAKWTEPSKVLAHARGVWCYQCRFFGFC